MLQRIADDMQVNAENGETSLLNLVNIWFVIYTAKGMLIWQCSPLTKYKILQAATAMPSLTSLTRYARQMLLLLLGKSYKFPYTMILALHETNIISLRFIDSKPRGRQTQMCGF